MTKKTDEKVKTPAKKGATELADEQLDKISGGPHFTTLDGLRSNSPVLDQLPAGSIRKNKI